MFVPKAAVESVMLGSDPMPEDSVPVRGYDFNKGVDYHALLQSYKTCGFQATNFGLAVDEVQRMLDKRREPIDPEAEAKAREELGDTYKPPRNNCTIFLGYTSNMVSSGVRDTIRFLVQHKMVDVIVSTAGGIEEDFIQCMAPTYMGDFNLPGAELRVKGFNRIGNLLLPNDHYVMFEGFMRPILNEMHDEQEQKGTRWTPSRLIAKLGERINNPQSVYYWAWRNDIPVFSPAVTDGAIGDMFYLHSYRRPGLVLDLVEDIRGMDDCALHAHNSGLIILGGGLIKHHICNANLMRNGADFSVFVNTAQEFDGSDSGARPDEAVSWGKIKPEAKAVKVYGEASLIFPLLVAETFAREVHGISDEKDEKKAAS